MPIMKTKSPAPPRPKTKTAYVPAERKFDVKFLFAGNSGSGKTELAASYTRGPVHFYMFDKGGKRTIDKKLKSTPRPSDMPLTLDDFSHSDNSFSDFWTAFQEDESNGFFDSLAANNGLLVLDSLTAANLRAIKEIQIKNSITPSGIGKKVNHKLGMAMPHWGQLLDWMQTLTATIQELPCAAIVTVHLHTLMDSDQTVVARYPSVNGQFRQLLAVDFDEAYLLEAKGGKFKLNFRERFKYEAKTRIFDMKDATNVTMDHIADAYRKFQTTL
ncbi:MAG: AAA family ATPase [Planctomycetes bacterium]|nr:AAA family ATPase [Planctomycetota bacterium]